MLDQIITILQLKDQLVKSEYFRDYAYTNQFEFLAVLTENFIETPEDFKYQFPRCINTPSRC